MAVSAFAGESPYKPGPVHYYCVSNPAPKTRYYSGLFEAPSSGDAYQQVSAAFQQFIAKQYSYKGPATCFGSPDKDAAQKQMQQQITQLKNVSKWKIIETGWTNSAAQAGSSAANTSHPDCNSADEWKSVAEYKAACEGAAQSGSQGTSPQPENAASQAPLPQMQNSNSGGEGQSNATAVGTTLAVRMTEAVDSTKDGMGRQYHGIVTKPASAGSVTIPQGSVAIVMLAKNQSSWVAQLHSVIVKGQTISVSSGPASLMNSAQSMAAGAMNSVGSLFGGFKKHTGAAAAAEAVASGNRVVLPPGTQLHFVLNSVSAAPNAAYGGGGAMQPTGANAASMSAAGNTTAVATGGALKAKVSEVRLGPTKAGGMYVVSPDGGHYAAFSMHGSREVIVVDGVDGPEFDHAAHAYTSGGIDVVFNKDGKHSAYIAQSGDSLVVVVDGKQQTIVEQLSTSVGTSPGTIPRINIGYNYPPYQGTEGAPDPHQVLLSPSGLHYACIAPQPGGANKVNMVLDGSKGPDMMSIDENQVAFVNEQLVYAGITPDHNWHVAVNNKLGPEYGELRSLRVTADAKHYAFTASTQAGRMVVIDGKPGTVRQYGGNGIHELVLASNGRAAYVGDLFIGGQGHQNTVQTLFVDDHEVSRDIQPFATIDRVGNHVQRYAVFSPDGTKFAYAKRVPGGVAAVIDGKVGRPYDGIGLTEFSQDSKHAFSVGIRGQSFVAIDGKEMPGINRLDNFIFSNDGMHFAYQAYSQDGNHVVVDGKESPRYYSIFAHSLAFSPDSKHYIYGACTNIMKCAVIRDGEVTNVPSLSEFYTRTFKPAYAFPPVFFSPDSNQVAYAYSKSDGTSQTVYFINGQEMVHGTSFEFPAFGPDSKHFVVMGWNGHGYALFADGKMGPTYQDIPEANLNVARFEDHDTYRFLGVREGSVYRVTVDLEQ